MVWTIGGGPSGGLTRGLPAEPVEVPSFAEHPMRHAFCNLKRLEKSLIE